MKKSILFMVMAVGLLTACDPSKDDVSAPSSSLTAEQLSGGFTFTQYGDKEYTTQAADGNYFTFATSPSRVVSIYQLDEDGAKSVLVSGVANGKFSLVPKRGNPSEQKIYIETLNFDGSKVVTEKTVNVYVPSELTPEMRLLASDDGEKIWKWDEDFGCWGNVGYAAGDGESFVNEKNGVWFAVGAPGILNTPDQVKNAPNSEPQGDASSKAYMKFKDDGTIEVYDSIGNVLRTGKFEMKDYDGTRHIASIDGSQKEWSYGTLSTSGGCILWPFKINSGGETPKDFEVLQLDANHLKLIYAASGTSSWAEATWWAFKSESDGIAALTDYGTKEWTWDTEFRSDGGAWGNMGYAPGDGASFANEGNGIWFACPPEYLESPNAKGETQMEHSDSETPLGEGLGAYMTFDWKSGFVTTYNEDGKQIRQGKYEIQDWGNGERTVTSGDGSQNLWAMGRLHTDAGSILWPFKINGGGEKPTDFEIMQLDGDHLKLIYAAPNTSSWSEATWWAFKAKK